MNFDGELPEADRQIAQGIVENMLTNTYKVVLWSAHITAAYGVHALQLPADVQRTYFDVIVKGRIVWGWQGDAVSWLGDAVNQGVDDGPTAR